MADWQEPYYWGRHDRRYSADDGIGYQYNAIIRGNVYAVPIPDDRIIRAIPVDGVVNTGSWVNSPQANYWLGDPRPTLWERFMAWLNK